MRFWISVFKLPLADFFYMKMICEVIQILTFCTGTSWTFLIPDLSSGVLEVNAFETTIRKSGESREDVLLFKL